MDDGELEFVKEDSEILSGFESSFSPPSLDNVEFSKMSFISIPKVKSSSNIKIEELKVDMRIDQDKILENLDLRTSVIIKNIPALYSSD